MNSGSCVHLIRMFHFQNFSLANRITIIKVLNKVKMESQSEHFNECPRFYQNFSETICEQALSFSEKQISSEGF